MTTSAICAASFFDFFGSRSFLRTWSHRLTTAWRTGSFAEPFANCCHPTHGALRRPSKLEVVVSAALAPVAAVARCGAAALRSASTAEAACRVVELRASSSARACSFASGGSSRHAPVGTPCMYSGSDMSRSVAVPPCAGVTQNGAGGLGGSGVERNA